MQTKEEVLVEGCKLGIDMCAEYMQRWADNVDTLPTSSFNMSMSWLIRKAARDISKMKDELK